MTELCQGPDPHVRKPKMAVPKNTTDTHFHLFGPASRYPYADGREYTPPDAPAADARAMFDTLGVQRCVVIQPSVYGLDNRCQLEQGAALGIPFRAVVVTERNVPDAELARMHDLGARGMRFILAHAGGLTPDDLEYYADRLKEIGWHIQLMVRPHHLVELESRLAKLSCTIVIDHMAMVKPEEGVAQPAFQGLLRLLRNGGCWVKMTGAYRLSQQPPYYPDMKPFAAELVKTKADRLIWGTDWPNVHFNGPAPNAGDLLDLLGEWVPDAAARQRILVDNPAALYGFDD
ncbi:MAG: amidohydrolase [Variibacter sp.]